MSDFKVGDRVCVYGTQFGTRTVGSIDEILDHGKVSIFQPPMTKIIAHSKQCRRLANKDRLRFWVAAPLGLSRCVQTMKLEQDVSFYRPADTTNWREFIEVKKK